MALWCAVTDGEGMPTEREWLDGAFRDAPVVKIAWCAPGEERRAEAEVDFSVDRDALVRSTPLARPGELRITASTLEDPLPPWDWAWRDFLERCEQGLSLSEMLRERAALTVLYRQ